MGFVTAVTVDLDLEGNAIRRLRYCSEGGEQQHQQYEDEEEENSSEALPGMTSLRHGPLPDLVPVSAAASHVRERSLSAPQLERAERQRAIERAVGRELRHLSDELVRSHEAALRDRLQRGHLGLAAVHAELSEVTSLFVTGVRRLLLLGLTAYCRPLLHWTAGTRGSPQHLQDSCVDGER